MTSVINEAIMGHRAMAFTYEDRNITVALIELTPELAKQFLENNHPLNRDIKSPKVDIIKQNIREGQFLFTADTIKVDEYNRTFDGQHRCTAVVESGIAVPTLVVWGLDPDVMNVIGQETPRSIQDLLKISDREIKYVNEVVAAQSLLISINTELRHLNGNRPVIADMVWENREKLMYWVGWADKLYATSDLYIDPKHPLAAKGKVNNKRAVGKTVMAMLGLLMVDSGADPVKVDDFFTSILTGVAADEQTRQMATMVRRYLSKTSPLIRVGGGNSPTTLMVNFDTIIRTYNRWAQGELVTKVQPARNPEDIKSIADVVNPVKKAEWKI